MIKFYGRPPVSHHRSDATGLGVASTLATVTPVASHDPSAAKGLPPVSQYHRLTARPAEPLGEFLDLAAALELQFPYVYVEIARTRATDWMAWICEKPKGAAWKVSGQGETGPEACADCLKNWYATQGEQS